MVLEDDSPMEAASTPSTPRNLSAWNITIPYIDFYDDDIKRERIPVFCIDVERNDRKAGEARFRRGSWTFSGGKSVCIRALILEGRRETSDLSALINLIVYLAEFNLHKVSGPDQSGPPTPGAR